MNSEKKTAMDKNINCSDYKRRGQVYTFYSYKGGCGRSMALANTAVLLSYWGERVLIADWDLEAPGIENFFQEKGFKFEEKRRDKQGIIELFEALKKNEGSIEAINNKWRNCLMKVHPSGNHMTDIVPIDILGAGKDDDNYLNSVRKINWEDMYDNYNLGEYIIELREEWIKEYDFILIDSRTGMNDICSLCTILFPHVLMLFFTANEQSYKGVKKVLEYAEAQRKKLSISNFNLSAVPILCRDQGESEYERIDKEKNEIINVLSELYDSWLGRGYQPIDALNTLSIPYIPYWDHGAPLPVVQKPDEINNPRSISAAYNKIAKLMHTELNWSKVSGEKQSIQIHKKHLGGLIKSLGDIITTILASDEVEIPEDEKLKQRICEQIKKDTKFIFFISNDKRKDEIENNYLNELDQKLKIGKENLKKKIKFLKLNFKWNDVPYIFYRFQNNKEVSTRKILALRGDIVKSGFSELYCSIPKYYAYTLLSNLFGGIDRSIMEDIGGNVEFKEFADEDLINRLFQNARNRIFS